MDIATIRQYLKELKNARNIVVLQQPKPRASEQINESIAWLKHEADDVISLTNVESLGPLVENKLRDLS